MIGTSHTWTQDIDISMNSGSVLYILYIQYTYTILHQNKKSVIWLLPSGWIVDITMNIFCLDSLEVVIVYINYVFIFPQKLKAHMVHRHDNLYLACFPCKGKCYPHPSKKNYRQIVETSKKKEKHEMSPPCGRLEYYLQEGLNSY